MKRLILALFTIHYSLFTYSQSEYWKDPAVNEEHRMAMHADLHNQNEQRMSLHGLWNITVQDYPAALGEAPKTMPIPGMWELNGVGEPMYCGQDYEWKTWWKSNPPLLPDSANYSVTYTREWKIPASWKGKDIILHIGSVTSCVTLWVNGKYVGYGEDSKLEQEFDVTRYLHYGKENEIKMLVRRWCDGSYLEDQDFFRFKGFARETYLTARPKNRIIDVQADALLNDDLTKGTVCLKVKTQGKVKWQATLDGSNGLSIDHPRLWSAEHPNLYPLHITSDQGDDITLQVGFRRIEIRNSQLLVNNQPVLIKGVNRHELDPDGGYVVSHERMEADVKLLKSWNVNALRMSHYPNDPYMYELCDRYGLYVVSETNIETHGMGFKEKTLAKNPLFKWAHMERNQRHVAARRNHPSIIIWSMGNECGYGDNFEQVYDWLKVEDPTRPIQFEQAYDKQRATDIYCPMYPTYGLMDRYLADSTKQKPMIMCEYAHSMGNAVGELDEYWNRIRRSPKAQGGFIWDMVDQAVRMPNGTYGYDGDWKTTQTGDHNFCVNGLFNPDRRPNPQAHEVRYYYQNIWTSLIDAHHVSVRNENFFSDLGDVTMQWSLIRNGIIYKEGTIKKITTPVQDSITVEIPYGELPQDDAEYLLDVDYYQAGQRIAYEQFTLREGKTPNENGNQCEVQYAFDPETGFLSQYRVAGIELLKEGEQLRPNFWRAPTDDDYGAKMQRKFRVWKEPEMRLTNFQQTEKAVDALYEMPSVNCRLHMHYDIASDGSIEVTQQLLTDSTHRAPNMFRFGMQLPLIHSLEQLTYYGRGPWENYQNRKASAELGLWQQTVTDQFYPYVRPQENGTKCDVQWLTLTDGQGIGLCIEGNDFSFSALHHTIDQLDDGIDKDKVEQNTHSELIPDAGLTNLCIDQVQQGQAVIDSWSAQPLPKYQIPSIDRTFKYAIKPYIK